MSRRVPVASGSCAERAGPVRLRLGVCQPVDFSVSRVRAQAKPPSKSESECRPCGSSIPGGGSPRSTVSLRPRPPKEGAMCELAGHCLFPRQDPHSIGGGARRRRQRFPRRSRVAASSRSAPYGRVRRAGSLCAGGAGPRTGRQSPAQPPRQRRASAAQPCPVPWPAGRGSLSRPRRPRPNPLWRPAQTQFDHSSAAQGGGARASAPLARESQPAAGWS